MFAQRRLSRMAGLLLASLLIPSAITTLAAAQAAPLGSAAKLKKCRDPKALTPSDKPPRYIRVTGVSCAAALALGRKVIVKAPRGCLEYTDASHIRLTRPCRVSRFRCTSRPIAGGIALEATCKRGAKIVRFQAVY
jgi:hypothetical protein